MALAQVHNALPCQYGLGGSDPDIGKITGLGEPSMTKDGQLLYFVYMRKTLAGEPLPTCVTGSVTPPCKCETSGTPTTGCTLPPCQFFELDEQQPGTNCTRACGEYEKKHDLDCVPWSLLLCKEPTESQPDSADGVDAYEFGIGVARKPHFDVSIGAVQVAQLYSIGKAVP